MKKIFESTDEPEHRDAARGYEEVVNILLRMPRDAELGKELARRLEAAKRPGQ